MSVSKTTKQTEALLDTIRHVDAKDALRALAYLHGEAVNVVYDIVGATWDQKREVLKRTAEFATARYEQSLGLEDDPADPDEDLL